ncbi:CcmD family protein [Aridibaculum aurantiacum]|uniref:CcmD family protein n=1 Tax=Aridibaculum aurantiacum TaxID=2810307 RepID=UPI001A966A94|nr:hypothetical protein [Aridibaculum aurantiacum]
MVNLKKLLFIIGLFSSNFVLAQQTVQDVVKDDEGWMRSEEKIWVVGAVALTVLVGLVIYVIRLDRKISSLEKKQ